MYTGLDQANKQSIGALEPQAARTPEIPLQVRRLESAISNLETELENLRGRFAAGGVLRSEPPTAIGAGDRNPVARPAVQTPMGQTLDELISRVDGSSVQIRSMRELAEI